MESRFGSDRATRAIRINVASGVLALLQPPPQVYSQVRVCQLLLEFIFSLFLSLSLSTAAIGELQIKVPAGITVPFGTTTTPSRMQ